MDEALSVGDAKFARKCYGKIDEFRSQGRTILMVSHDINTINNFCDHAILLENGKIFEQGRPYHVSQVYYELLFGDQKKLSATLLPVETPPEATGSPETSEAQSSSINDVPQDDRPEEKKEVIVDPAVLAQMDRDALRKNALQLLQMRMPYLQGNTHMKRIGNKKGEILDYGIQDAMGRRTMMLVSGAKYRLFSKAVFYEDVPAITSGFVIRNIKGVDIFGTSSLVQRLQTVEAKKGTVIKSCCDVTMWLTNGVFFLSVALANPYATEEVQYDLLYDAYQFEIEMKPDLFTPSLVNLDAQPIVRNFLAGKADFKPLAPHILASIR